MSAQHLGGVLVVVEVVVDFVAVEFVEVVVRSCQLLQNPLRIRKLARSLHRSRGWASEKREDEDGRRHGDRRRRSGSTA